MKGTVIVFLIGLLSWSGLSLATTGVTTIPADVTGQIEVIKSGLVYNRTTKTFNSLLTLTNSSKTPIYGSISIAVNISDPTKITLANSAGISSNGGSYPVIKVALPKGILPPGSSVDNVLLEFSNPTQEKFTFTLEVFAAIDPSTQGSATINNISPNAAPSGAIITLNGTGFTSTSQISFGSIKIASFDFISSQQISFMVPVSTNNSGQLIPLTQGIYPVQVDNSITYNFSVTALPNNPNPAGATINTFVTGIQQSYTNMLPQFQTSIAKASSLYTDPNSQQIFTQISNFISSTSTLVSNDLSNAIAELDSVSLDTLERVLLLNQLDVQAAQLASNTKNWNLNSLAAKHNKNTLPDDLNASLNLTKKLMQILTSAIVGKSAQAATTPSYPPITAANINQWFSDRQGVAVISQWVDKVDTVANGCFISLVPGVLTGPGEIIIASVCADLKSFSTAMSLGLTFAYAEFGQIADFTIKSTGPTGGRKCTLPITGSSGQCLAYYYEYVGLNVSNVDVPFNNFNTPQVLITHKINLLASASKAAGFLKGVGQKLQSIPPDTLSKLSNNLKQLISRSISSSNTLNNYINNLANFGNGSLYPDEQPVTVGFDMLNFVPECQATYSIFGINFPLTKNYSNFFTIDTSLSPGLAQIEVPYNLSSKNNNPLQLVCSIKLNSNYTLAAENSLKIEADYTVTKYIKTVLTKSGTGDGLVTSAVNPNSGNTNNSDINCATGCASGNAKYLYDPSSSQTVVLTATPNSSSTFTGWSVQDLTGQAFNCQEGTNSQTTCTLNLVGNPINITAQFNNNSCQIGSPGPAGGIIFYVNPGSTDSSCHGLEAAPEDQTPSTWGCWGWDASQINTAPWYGFTWTTIGSTGTAIGTGAANTAAIIAACGTGGGAGNGNPYYEGTATNAAATASAYTLNGYSDWYLPSQDELNQLYLNQGVVGGFANDFYWSSSESGSYYAWNQHFTNGYQYTPITKLNPLGVRAVRAF